MEAHDKLGHQGNSCTYCLIKCQYYWKGWTRTLANILQTVFFAMGEGQSSTIPLQMTEILDRPFDKIAFNLVMECETSTSGNKHFLTIIDHLTRWPEAFPIPDKSCRYNSCYIYQWILTSTYVPPIYFVWQWHRIQEQPDGPSSATSWHWQNFLCSLSPPEQWKTRSFPQVFATNIKETLREGPHKSGQIPKSGISQLQNYA